MRVHLRLISLISLLALVLISLAPGCNLDLREREISPVSPLESPISLLTVSSPKCSPVNAFYGAVTGRLFLTNGQPAVGSIVYLGEYVGLGTSNPVVILDPSRHLHTQTDEEGVFCFSEVPPGRYGLIVWNAVESILLSDPATGYSLLLEIKSGEKTDVGVLYSPIP